MILSAVRVKMDINISLCDIVEEQISKDGIKLH